MSPELVALVMFGVAIVGILLGYPLAFILAGTAVLVGLVTIGPGVSTLFRLRIWGMITSYAFLALPLFVYMGLMVTSSGAADRLYGGLHLVFGGFRGGLAVTTILMGTILAACVGVIAASIIMIGLIAAPNMLQRGYNKELACGSICAGGTLGILIPPSIMLVIYGPMAGLSVGKLFMAAFGPGLLLSALYVSYVSIRCWLNPKLAPPISEEERAVPLLIKLRKLIAGVMPPLLLMLSVLGAIFFGVASPTEAAALGGVAATLLMVAYGRANWRRFKGVILETVRITSMAFIIGWGASMFTGLFLRLGGGEVIQNLLVAAPFGKWGAFALVMLMVFILGFLIDWMGIVFIVIPLLTPLVPTLGFDPLWFAIMICVNLQMSFMTPPMAFAIFFLKGIAKPEWGINTGHIIRGVVPFVALIMIGMGFCIVFPEIILWLPHQMIKFA